jgi:hypothetical protein
MSKHPSRRRAPAPDQSSVAGGLAEAADPSHSTRRYDLDRLFPLPDLGACGVVTAWMPELLVTRVAGSTASTLPDPAPDSAARRRTVALSDGTCLIFDSADPG